MCLLCHEKLSDTTLLSQLTDCKSNPQYDQWNSTSLSHFAIMTTGLNGKENQTLALELYRGYIEWAKKSGKPSVDVIERRLARIENELIPLASKYTAQQIRQQLYSNPHQSFMETIWSFVVPKDDSVARLFNDIIASL